MHAMYVCTVLAIYFKLDRVAVALFLEPGISGSFSFFLDPNTETVRNVGGNARNHKGKATVREKTALPESPEIWGPVPGIGGIGGGGGIPIDGDIPDGLPGGGGGWERPD